MNICCGNFLGFTNFVRYIYGVNTVLTSPQPWNYLYISVSTFFLEDYKDHSHSPSISLQSLTLRKNIRYSQRRHSGLFYLARTKSAACFAFSCCHGAWAQPNVDPAWPCAGTRDRCPCKQGQGFTWRKGLNIWLVYIWTAKGTYWNVFV